MTNGNNKKFDIYEFLEARPLSHSALEAWKYSPASWYRKYILGVKDPENPEMKFGKVFALSCENRSPLAPVTLLSKMEHPFKVAFGKIHLVGYVDSFDDKKFKNLREYKTGARPWDQKRADNHKQFDMYLLMNYITNKVMPHEVYCELQWIPTKKVTRENGDFSGDDYTIEFAHNPPVVHTFPTRREMKDILAFGVFINRTVLEMQDYVRNHDK